MAHRNSLDLDDKTESKYSDSDSSYSTYYGSETESPAVGVKRTRSDPGLQPRAVANPSRPTEPSEPAASSPPTLPPSCTVQLEYKLLELKPPGRILDTLEHWFRVHQDLKPRNITRYKYCVHSPCDPRALLCRFIVEAAGVSPMSSQRFIIYRTTAGRFVGEVVWLFSARLPGKPEPAALAYVRNMPAKRDEWELVRLVGGPRLIREGGRFLVIPCCDIVEPAGIILARGFAFVVVYEGILHAEVDETPEEEMELADEDDGAEDEGSMVVETHRNKA